MTIQNYIEEPVPTEGIAKPFIWLNLFSLGPYLSPPDIDPSKLPFDTPPVLEIQSGQTTIYIAVVMYLNPNRIVPAEPGLSPCTILSNFSLSYQISFESTEPIGTPPNPKHVRCENLIPGQCFYLNVLKVEGTLTPGIVVVNVTAHIGDDLPPPPKKDQLEFTATATWGPALTQKMLDNAFIKGKPEKVPLTFTIIQPPAETYHEAGKPTLGTKTKATTENAEIFLDPRKSTQEEWDNLRTKFPSLSYDDVWVTGPASQIYNCIAWSLGYDDRWINPVSPLGNFVQLYQGYGWTSVPALSPVAKIDGWGSNSNMTHGSKLYEGVAVGKSGLWESKLGQYLRITHARQGLQRSLYGNVLVSFKKNTYMGTVVNSIEVKYARGNLLSNYEESVLHQELSKIPDELKEQFEPAFSNWKHKWFHGSLMFSSITHDRAKGHEFAQLVAMGPEIIPLVIEKLRDPNNFIALELYDKLQISPNLIIRYQLGDAAIYEGEQERARRTIKLWLRERFKSGGLL